MRFPTAVLFGVVVLGVAFAPAALAQVPNVALYTDKAFQEREIEGCPEEPPGAILDTLYVVASGFNMAMASIEYRIDLSPQLWFSGDIVPAGVAEGFSIDGIRISFATPADATGQLLVQKIEFIYGCQGCRDYKHPISIMDVPLRVLPHPESGKIQAFRWPDMAAVEAVGLPAILCPRIGVPIEGSTWGAIKSLYQ